MWRLLGWYVCSDRPEEPTVPIITAVPLQMIIAAGCSDTVTHTSQTTRSHIQEDSAFHGERCNIPGHCYFTFHHFSSIHDVNII